MVSQHDLDRSDTSRWQVSYVFVPCKDAVHNELIQLIAKKPKILKCDGHDQDDLL